MALVVPEGFLFKAALAPVRKYLFENAQLKAVVSLPKEVFLPYAKLKPIYSTLPTVIMVEQILTFFTTM